MSERGSVELESGRDVLLAAAMLALGGYAVGTIVASLVATVVEAGGIEVFDAPIRRQLLAALAIQGITFLGGSLAFLSLTDRWDLLRVRVPTPSDTAFVALGFGLLLGTFFAFGVVYDALGVSVAESSIVDNGQANPTLLLYLVPISILVVGPGEELLYRGLVQGWLRQSFGPVVAIGVTSVLFASIHISGYLQAGAPASSIVAALLIIAFLSVYLGALYEYTENLVVPALVHGLYNAAQFVLAYGQVTGAF